MHPLIQALRDWGCDTDCVQTRFMGDEAFYLSMLSLVKEDTSYALLMSALDAGDGKAAFDAAHTLKGMLGNMGFTPLLNPVCAIVELVRDGTMNDVSAPRCKLQEAYAEFLTILERNPI